MKSFNRLIFIAFTLLLTCCSHPYTIEDNGKKITLSEHDIFEITLEGDRNSNAVWKFAKDPQFVKIEGSKIDTLNTDVYTFFIEAVSQGEEQLKLVYTDGNTVTNHFEMTVIVGVVGLIEAE